MRSEDRILTTHVGSLVRPPELTEMLLKLQTAEPPQPAEIERELAGMVEEVVRQQAEAGVDIINDGEFGKFASWSAYIMDRLEGIEAKPGAKPDLSVLYDSKDRQDFAGFYEEYESRYGIVGLGKELGSRAALAVIAPLRYKPEGVRADIARLKSAMRAAGVERGFLPVVAPVSAVSTVENLHYSDMEALLFGVAEALHEEYREIIDAGLMVQIDDAYLASAYDAMVPPGSLEDYRKWAEMGIAALNHAIGNLPADRIRYHVCWGSWNGPHTNDVNARDIVDLILRVNVGGYSLEMANPRHEHEWRLWQTTKLPDGKVLYPGVVSHSTNVVEHPELVAERITRLARLVGRENVIASTDCGFAQGPFCQRVHPSIMWAKLRTIAEGARLASEELWRTRQVA